MLFGYTVILCAISTSALSSKSFTPGRTTPPGKFAKFMYMVPPLRLFNPPVTGRNITSKTHYLQPSTAVFSGTNNTTSSDDLSSTLVQLSSLSSPSFHPADSYSSSRSVYLAIVKHSPVRQQTSLQQYATSGTDMSTSYHLAPSTVTLPSGSLFDKSNKILSNVPSSQLNAKDTFTHTNFSSSLYTPRNVSGVTTTLFHGSTYLSGTDTVSTLSPTIVTAPFSTYVPVFSSLSVPYSLVASVYNYFSASNNQTLQSKRDISLTMTNPTSDSPLTSQSQSASSNIGNKPSNAFESIPKISTFVIPPTSSIFNTRSYSWFPSSRTSLMHQSKISAYRSMSFLVSVSETFSTPPLFSQIASPQSYTGDPYSSRSPNAKSLSSAASTVKPLISPTSASTLASLSSDSTMVLNNDKSSLLPSPATFPALKTVAIDSTFTARTSSSGLVSIDNSISSYSISADGTIVVSVTPTKSLSSLASTSPVPSSTSIPTIPTCLQINSYFPTYIEIDESEPVGSVLASMPMTTNVTFTVDVTEPKQLASIMQGYLGVIATASEYSLTLLKPVDVEKLYELSGNTVPVKDILVRVVCSEKYHNSVVSETMTINVTIWDEDDELPRFLNQDDDKTCVIPVYKADASEDYTGELEVKPGKIVAVDGDLFVQHNISYSVMHAEPENYHEFFYLNTIDGSVNKTRLINASDPRKYVLFIQAMEDSPQQKKKVAVLSIEVFAPSDPLGDDLSTVDPTVKLSLKVISALVILGFVSGFIVVAHHRWRRKKGRVNTEKFEPCEIAREMKLPVLAVYRSSVSSIECEPTESTKGIPTISSPSQIQVIPAGAPVGLKKKKVIVKKPIDTRLRPGWNAPKPKKKPIQYSPYKSVKLVKTQ